MPVESEATLLVAVLAAVLRPVERDTTELAVTLRAVESPT